MAVYCTVTDAQFLVIVRGYACLERRYARHVGREGMPAGDATGEHERNQPGHGTEEEEKMQREGEKRTTRRTIGRKTHG